MTGIFKRKIPILYAFLCMIIGGIFAYFLINNSITGSQQSLQKNAYSDTIVNNNLNTVRLNGYHYIRPILFAEPRTESARYASLKTEINKIIDKNKADGILATASVYFRRFKDGEWIEINPQDSFQPGSLLKIPILITFLKMDEDKPGVLNSYVICDKLHEGNVVANITTKTIKVGQRYTAKELLHYMIVNSDNNATFLLEQYMNMDIYNKVYTDLGINISNLNSRDLFHLSARQYSVFFKILFNATYLNNDHSEFAASMLCESDFKDGLIKELPQNVKVAHKFGETGTQSMQELSESGIVYLKDKTYLITIMTRGREQQKLATVISDISKLVYNTINEGDK